MPQRHSIMNVARKAVAAAVKKAKTPHGRSQCENVTLTESYAEPGYDEPESGVIAFGNWNCISHWDEAQHKFVDDDDAPAQLAKKLEKLGVELQWEDEWATCNDCGGAVRTAGDSYNWKRAYWERAGDVVCALCTLKDPEEYLKYLEGNPSTAATFDIDLDGHGYTCLERGFEHGFHPGQDADPRVIAKSLRALGVTRFIFTIDHLDQFDIDFSVWVHKDDLANLDQDAWATAKKDGPSVSDGLHRALQDAAAKTAALPDVPGHVKVASCDASTGTAKARNVAPDDFVQGQALDFPEEAK